MDPKEFRQKTVPLVVREDFGEGRSRFTVELRLCDRRELELMYNRCSKKVFDRKTRQKDTEVDTVAFRRELVKLVQGWEGLTWRKLCILTSVRFAENGAGGDFDLDQDVPVTDEWRLHLLEAALDFENWVVERVTQVSEDLTQQLEDEKKTSSSTPVAS